MKNILLDCNYICYRSIYSIGPLEYKGTPTGVIFGFLNQLYYICEELRPERIIFCWDSKKSLRRRKYPFYKNRDREMDEEMKNAFAQFDLLRLEIIPRLGFKNNFMHNGYEADDLLAIIVQQYLDEDFTIVGTDQDLYQLLSRCRIYDPYKKEFMDQERFINEYGIPPTLWADVKKLGGCTSDTVPGIPIISDSKSKKQMHVGEKTAIKYLKDELKESTKAYQSIISEEGKEIYARNGWLVKLPLQGTKCPELQEDEKMDRKELVRICKQYGFDSWLDDTSKIDDFIIFTGR